MALVDNALRELAPNIAVIINPSNRYITIIENPYIIASLTEFTREVFFFKKKLTVSGIIGHTQGVSSASNPPKNPPKNIYQNECEPLLLVVPPAAFELDSSTGAQMPERVVSTSVVGVPAVNAGAESVSAKIGVAAFATPLK